MLTKSCSSQMCSLVTCFLPHAEASHEKVLIMSVSVSAPFSRSFCSYKHKNKAPWQAVAQCFFTYMELAHRSDYSHLKAKVVLG